MVCSKAIPYLCAKKSWRYNHNHRNIRNSSGRQAYFRRLQYVSLDCTLTTVNLSSAYVLESVVIPQLTTQSWCSIGTSCVVLIISRVILTLLASGTGQNIKVGGEGACIQATLNGEAVHHLQQKMLNVPLWFAFLLFCVFVWFFGCLVGFLACFAFTCNWFSCVAVLVGAGCLCQAPFLPVFDFFCGFGLAEMLWAVLQMSIKRTVNDLIALSCLMADLQVIGTPVHAWQ